MEDIQKMVFQDLAGGGEDTDCIDICELVAMLLIPFFAKVRTKNLLLHLSLYLACLPRMV